MLIGRTIKSENNGRRTGEKMHSPGDVEKVLMWEI